MNKATKVFYESLEKSMGWINDAAYAANRKGYNAAVLSDDWHKALDKFKLDYPEYFDDQDEEK